VDLEAQEITWDGGSARFEIDADTKHRLLNGLDEIGLTLQREDAIAAYEAERERPGPVTTAL
jgi:3-isopropylmalate/(R)-2-methylmalate dehydratase small subunit